MNQLYLINELTLIFIDYKIDKIKKGCEMSTYRTWDNINSEYDLQIQGSKIVVTNNPNPYKENTEEYCLVEYIKSLEDKSNYYMKDSFVKDILALYVKNKVQAPIDPWYIYSLFPKALWLARACGCIQLVHKVIDNNKLQFACFLEAGMKNYLKIDLFKNYLTTMKNRERANHLLNVLEIANKFYEDYNIPYITYEENKIIINKKHHENFMKIDSIPIQTWNTPEEWDISIETRGLFHHLGDDLAFLFAASEYGDAYIVGNDEFGDLIILGVIPYKGNKRINTKYKLNQKISSQDIDFLYGVPRANALYPTKLNNCFNYSAETSGYCKLNNQKNSEISYYWNTETFKKYAKRNIDNFNYEEFISFIEEKINKVLSLKKYKQQNTAFKCLLKNTSELKKQKNEYLWSEQEFKKDLYEALSFFYKTTAHKVKCEIINPTNDTQLGFFLKETNDKHCIYADSLYKSLIDIKNNNPQISTIHNLLSIYFENELFALEDNSYKHMLKYWKEINNKFLVVSNIVDMQNEYRIFVINHRPVSGSPCFRNSTPFDAYDKGRFNPRLCVGHSAYNTIENEDTRKRVSQYAKFAKKFCEEMKLEKPNCGNYVLDVAWSDTINNVLAIEINTVSWSGAYQIDMRRVCAAVAKKPFYITDMENLGNFENIRLDCYEDKQEINIDDDNMKSLNDILKGSISSFKIL